MTRQHSLTSKLAKATAALAITGALLGTAAGPAAAMMKDQPADEQTTATEVGGTEIAADGTLFDAAVQIGPSVCLPLWGTPWCW